MIKLKHILNEADESKQEEFAETRLGGAEKITDNAKEKGGLALLTWHHFKVKLPYYKKAVDGELDMESARKEYVELLQKLYDSTFEKIDITQVSFQELVGKLEVLGELLIENK